jgi:hypothetical protein
MHNNSPSAPTQAQHVYYSLRNAADEAAAKAHDPANRRNSTGTFEGGRMAAFEEALRMLVEFIPDSDPEGTPEEPEEAHERFIARAGDLIPVPQPEEDVGVTYDLAVPFEHPDPADAPTYQNPWRHE